MRKKTLAYGLFGLGFFMLVVHTTLPALWQVLGLPGQYPLASTEGILGLSAGFTPPLGATLLLAAGLVYGSQKEGPGR